MISHRVATTWSTAVPRVARLLVPISAEALVVRSTDGDWAETRAGATGGAAPLFQRRSAPHAKGVYLHWALPDALTRGSDAGGALRFPAIPDRWLVLRLSPDAGGAKRDVKGWVLVSGDAKPSVVELDRWHESGRTAQDLKGTLTALGHGDPTWAARFDEVENRLGFYDALDGVAAGPLAYLVCGWHADPASDPLGGPDAHVTSSRMARLGALGWSAPGIDVPSAAAQATAFRAAAAAAGLTFEAPPADAEPMLSLYHGAVVGLGWPDGGLLGDVSVIPPADSVRIVLASTITEALATIASPESPPLQMRIVQAVAARAEAALDAPDGRAKLDAALHARSFTSYPGGSAIETVWQPPAEPQPQPPGQPPHRPPGLTGTLAGALETLDAPSIPSTPGRPPLPGVRFERVRALRHDWPYEVATATVGKATLTATINSVTPPAPPSPSEPGKFVQVERPLPSFHAPMDPVLLLQGARRAFRHGGDGRFSLDGTLACRATGANVTSASIRVGDQRFTVHADRVLTRGVDNGSVPMECDALLRELVLLDPGSAGALAGTTLAAATVGAASATAGELDRRTRQFAVEQTAWWALREPRVDPTPILVHSGLEGVLPSPQAITPPVSPWTPLYVEWEAEYLGSTGGAGDWSLGEVDFTPDRDATAEPVVVGGRTLLSAAPARLAAGAARDARALAQRVGTATRLPPNHVARFASDVAGTLTNALAALDQAADGLSDLVGRLDAADLLAGSLAPFRTDLRGGVPGDGASVPGDGVPTPSPFIALRAGFLRLRRLRLVDGFGRFLDLAGSSDTTPVDPSKIVWAESLSVPDRPEHGLLPPRFTSPARLMLRMVDASGTPTDADDLSTPVCGFVLPNHLEEAVEVFDAAGSALGILRQDDTLLWEPAPGMAGTAGRSPERTIDNPFLAGVVRGLLDHAAGDVSQNRPEHALGAFLRAVDSTTWTVDPFAHSGDEHLSLLVGHPIALIRARLWLEVKEPVAPDSSGRAYPVKLGSLAQWQDGLLGYYVDDDYRRLHLPDGAAASYARELGPGQGFLQRIDQVPGWFSSFAADLAGDPTTGRAPITHPEIGTDGVLWIRPGQIVRLTLLVEPHATVHATTGLLPRESVGMRRRWVSSGLARIAPTFRFGPVLVDPNSVRMPVARDVGGTWSWVSRESSGVWNDAEVRHDPGDAALSADRPRATEGWLKLVPDPPAEAT